jgi:hypothetical protein
VGALSKSLLLFSLNWLDAQLTILWVRMNVATEGNGLMASLLNTGELPFLTVKLAVGAFTAYILYRCAHLRIARNGMRFVLAVYLLLLVVHTATGFSALGWHAPATVFSYLANFPSTILAHFS